MPRIIDISPPITPSLAVWPGDVPFRRDCSLRLAEGANLDLSSIHTTVHLGAHADAPAHYAAGAPGIGERPLELYYGPCEVVKVDVGPGERVLPRHLPASVSAPRVLVCTGSFPDPERFNEDFAALSPQLLDHLAAQGVVLVGIDTPSVDLFASRSLPTHQAALRHDMALLEGLVLTHVAPGRYTLVALPLAIVGADASPVRAALVTA
ncbi:MAG: kynurenine formamidase [Deltaproteobacteria bacterium]|nr:MAG: kynurenine formamidase [Deltaproteobacteria bacterium]